MTHHFAKFVLSLGLLFWLTTSGAHGQSLHTVGQLTVFDADGKTVGKVLDAGNPSGEAVHVNVAFKVGGPGTSGTTFLVLNVYRDGFATDADEGIIPPVAWESNDCSGTPFLGRFIYSTGIPYPGGSMPLVAVGIPGNTVYVETGPPQEVTIGSYSTPTVASLAYDDSQPVSSCVNTGFVVGAQIALFPARALINMNDHFRAPFAVRESD